MGERALSRCKEGPERALLVKKGCIGWRNGRIRLEKATLRAHADENCISKRRRKQCDGCCSGG